MDYVETHGIPPGTFREPCLPRVSVNTTDQLPTIAWFVQIRAVPTANGPVMAPTLPDARFRALSETVRPAVPATTARPSRHKHNEAPATQHWATGASSARRGAPRDYAFGAGLSRTAWTNPLALSKKLFDGVSLPVHSGISASCMAIR